MAIKHPSHGITMTFGDYVSGAHTEADLTLGSVTSIGDFGIEAQSVDVTDTASTIKEYISGGLARGNNCTVGILADGTAGAGDGEHVQWLTYLEAGTKLTVKFTLTLPGTADYVHYPAIATGYSVNPGSTTGTNAVEGSVSFQITDDFTWT